MSIPLVVTKVGFALALKDMLICMAVFVGLCGAAHCGAGCMPSQAPNAKEQSYTAAIVGCAATAKTKAEDHACRVRVNKDYGLCDGSAAELPGDCE